MVQAPESSVFSSAQGAPEAMPLMQTTRGQPPQTRRCPGVPGRQQGSTQAPGMRWWRVIGRHLSLSTRQDFYSQPISTTSEKLGKKCHSWPTTVPTPDLVEAPSAV